MNAVRRCIRWFAATPAGAWVFARTLHHLDRAVFRASGGRHTLTALLAGLPVVMLSTTGARSGQPRTVPMLGFPVGEELAVAAGNFGSPHDPAWCRNLRADPHATVAVRGQARRVVAEELRGDSYDHVWRLALEVYPGGAAYARRAGGRRIALFLLHDDAG